jgi:hypothetical protein
MPGELRPYVIRQGDHLLKLAHQLGFDADAIWGDAKNADLKSLRGDGHILCPGDILYVPEPSPKPLDLAAQSSNAYSATVPTITVEVIFKDSDGKAFANEPYQVKGLAETAADDAPEDPKTGGDGRVDFTVPVHIRELEVFFPRRNVVFRLGIGDLDPHDERSGMLQRLRNLGLIGENTGERLLSGAGTDADLGRLEDAMKTLQASYGLEPTGEESDELKAKLQTDHGR